MKFLLLCCSVISAECMLENAMINGYDITKDNFRPAYSVYIQKNGFIYWKADGEYLMSDGFVHNLLSEIQNSKSMYVDMINNWISSAMISASFDRAFDCLWHEKTRDLAPSFLDIMINCYNNYLKECPNETIKDKMIEIIEDLDYIKEEFFFVTCIGDRTKRKKKKTRDHL